MVLEECFPAALSRVVSYWEGCLSLFSEAKCLESFKGACLAV